jgi:hypothetical protein
MRESRPEVRGVEAMRRGEGTHDGRRKKKF